jgi:methionyl-tRNA formyltransferase
MDTGFDTGDIACSVVLPMISGETLGLCSARLAQESVKLVIDLVCKIREGRLHCTKQDEVKASYYARPGMKDMVIDWSRHDSAEIQRIVHACNPLFQGALTMLNGMPVRILEVAPVEAPDYPAQEPGTLVHADSNHGVFVVCRDRKTLRILVVHIPEGIISGAKLVALGIQAGARFGNMAL